ncbi:MAG: hypothetical protein E5W70_29240 [Mesorhizobium sp.]|uniref:hypothetical protein n=1 Tax=Mesorhizobium sp. TaxID=1871066 RepID=UPI0012107BE2|nr:hypothetical protein [Mesorhizobium sp.]TIT18432.1 MAG: hypothetical protein E5W70_29240 [Mesorhizobium sp.]
MLRKYNITEQNIYLYYYNLVSSGRTALAMDVLRKGFSDVGTVGRISAVISCVSHAIIEYRDKQFVMFLLANVITSMNRFHLRDFLKTGIPLPFIQVHATSVKSIAVAESVRFDGKRGGTIEISADDLGRFARRASANSLFVHFENRPDAARNFSVSIDDLFPHLDAEWRELVVDIAAAASAVGGRIPYSLSGEASVRFMRGASG